MTTDSVKSVRTNPAKPDLAVASPRLWMRVFEPAVRRAIARLTGVVVFVLLMLRSLTPDVFAIVTNDSIGYIGRSRSLLTGGLVLQGYRQIGYPIWIRLVDEVRGVFGWDRLFAVALLQRIIFIVAVLIVWQCLRWWSLPLLVIATTSTTVVMSNFILTEGLSTPLSLLLAGLLIDLALRAETNTKRRFMTFLILAFMTLAFLAIVKLQFAAFLPLVIAVVALPSNKARLSRRGFIVAIGVPIVLVGSLVMVQSVENARELGVFEPVSEKARAEWYGAWQAVFQVHRADPTDPELAPYFEDGDLYAFLHLLEESEPDYLVRREIINERVATMFVAAKTTEGHERWSAIFGAMRGGRTDDLRQLVDNALEVSPRTLESAYISNTLGRNEGGEAVLRKVNDGKDTIVLTSGTLAPFLTRSVSDYRQVRPLIWMGGLALCAVGVLVAPRYRWVAAGAVAGVVGIAVALGLSYIDNGRYLLSGGLIGLSVATLIATDIFTRRSRG